MLKFFIKKVFVVTLRQKLSKTNSKILQILMLITINKLKLFILMYTVLLKDIQLKSAELELSFMVKQLY